MDFQLYVALFLGFHGSGAHCKEQLNVQEFEFSFNLSAFLESWINADHKAKQMALSMVYANEFPTEIEYASRLQKR